MSRDHLVVRVVYDRSINPQLDTKYETVRNLQRWLRQSAQRWCQAATVWDPNPKGRVRLDFQRPDELASAVGARTRTVLGFNSGSVEIHGATRDLVVTVSVNDRPTRPVGGRLLMPNEITVAVRTAKVEGRPRLDFAQSVFRGVCETSSPLWGAVHTNSEYTAKVMRTTPGLEAVGRDFSRHLPGLFAINFFGAKYLDLIGRERLQELQEVERLDAGALVPVTNPDEWEAASARFRRVLEAIGREYFFDKERPDAATLAPSWKHVDS